ncbi:hypothetical protein BGZ65_000505, partial [Modicella reniformis]
MALYWIYWLSTPPLRSQEGIPQRHPSPNDEDADLFDDMNADFKLDETFLETEEEKEEEEEDEDQDEEQEHEEEDTTDMDVDKSQSQDKGVNQITVDTINWRRSSKTLTNVEVHFEKPENHLPS